MPLISAHLIDKAALYQRLSARHCSFLSAVARETCSQGRTRSTAHVAEAYDEAYDDDDDDDNQAKVICTQRASTATMYHQTCNNERNLCNHNNSTQTAAKTIVTKVAIILLCVTILPVARASSLWLASSQWPQDLPVNWTQSSAAWRDADEQTRNKLATVLNRLGPNMRASAYFGDALDVKINETLLAWRIMHERLSALAKVQMHALEPAIRKLLDDNKHKLSSECRNSSLEMVRALGNLETWATEMWSATGALPPSGQFDGNFADLGSYQGCMSVQRPADVAQRYTSYCSFAFRPIVPSRKRFHLAFEQESPQLLNMFPATDAIHELAKFAQFYHYIYTRVSACVPFECTPDDMQTLANATAHSFVLQAAPVKCYTGAPYSPAYEASSQHDHRQLWLSNANDNIAHFRSDANEPLPRLVWLHAPINTHQLVAACIVGVCMTIVLAATIWHSAHLLYHSSLERAHKSPTLNGQQAPEEEEHVKLNINSDCSVKMIAEEAKTQQVEECQSRARKIAFEYLSIITNTREFFSVTLRRNEIQCLHGFRAITMMWIITVHTMQYNEWSGFTRSFEGPELVQDILLHPIVNANYVVDNFFLMSGLLTAYTTCTPRGKQAVVRAFNIPAQLVSRYLRLTPQVLLVTLLYILLPLAHDSLFWHDTTHEAAKQCERNWWINLLHAQAYYRHDDMCNLVSWWISVDMTYFVLAMPIIYFIVKHNQVIKAIIMTAAFVSISAVITTYRHYVNGYEPNNLGIVGQVEEVWRDFVTHFFWSPFPHAFPYFCGLWVGYMLANRMYIEYVRRYARIGWTLSVFTMLIVNLSTHFWMTGAWSMDNQVILTTFNVTCTILWALGFGWCIMASHFDTAPSLNKLLVHDTFVWLSKASFIIYLSHMLMVRAYFGSQNTLIEVSSANLFYIVTGNIVVSIAFGVFLCITIETPLMKWQRDITKALNGKSESACHQHEANEVSMSETTGKVADPIKSKLFESEGH